MISQQKEYTCGVAALRMALKKYNIHFRNEEELEKELNTTKEYGTDLNNILLFLNQINRFPRNNPIFSNSGILLVNTNIWANEFPKDGQNGHWVYFIQNLEDSTFKIFDPYTSKIIYLSMNEILLYTKNINIKNKIYNDIFLYI